MIYRCARNVKHSTSFLFLYELLKLAKTSSLLKNYVALLSVYFVNKCVALGLSQYTDFLKMNILKLGRKMVTIITPKRMLDNIK